MLETGKKDTHIVESSDSVRKPSVSNLASSLNFLLSKANIVRLGLNEVYQSELTENKVELERVRKLYLKMRERNELINKQNVDLLERLGVTEVKADTLSHEMAIEREDKEDTQAELDRVIAEHTV